MQLVIQRMNFRVSGFALRVLPTNEDKKLQSLALTTISA